MKLVYNGVNLEVGQVWRNYILQFDSVEPKYQDYMITGISQAGTFDVKRLSDGEVIFYLKPVDLYDMDLVSQPMTELNSLTSVLEEVERERVRQDKKWGEQNHGFADWMLILTEEVGEVAKEACDYAHYDKGIAAGQVLPSKQELGNKYRMELVQVAAVVVAMIQSYDRNEGSK